MELETLVARDNKHDDDAPLAVAADYGEVLPADMVREVLLRLPAHEVCRLRLVCRPWCSLTSEPCFVATHACRHPPHAAAFHPDRGEVHVVDLRSGDIVKRVRLDDHLGLPATAIQNLIQAWPCRWWQACALDVPATELAAAGAEHEIRSREGMPCSMVGHVPSTGEYKVISIYSYQEAIYNNPGCVFLSLSQTCDVVTLVDGGERRRTARPRPRPPAILALHDPWHMAVAGGVAYYMVNWWGSGDDMDRDSIASFDMAAEEWRPMTLHGPRTSGGSRPYTGDLRYSRLASLNGFLTAVRVRNGQDFTTDIWKLEDMERSLWTKQYSMLQTPWERSGFICPLVVLHDGRVVVWAQTARLLIAYDPRRSSWANLASLEGYSDIIGMHHGSLLCSSSCPQG